MTQAELDHLAGCRVIAGNLSISRFVGDLNALASLEEVSGELMIGLESDGEDVGEPGALQSLEGLESLRSVRDLTLWYLPVLEDLHALSSLEVVSQDFSAYGLTAVTSLHGPDRIRTIGRSLIVKHWDMLESIDGFGGLLEVARLEIGDAPRLREINGFGSVDRIDAIRLSMLPSLDAIPAITVLLQSGTVGSFSLGAIPQIPPSAFQNVESLGGLSISECSGLIDMSEFSDLRQLGSLSLSSNDNLVALSGLEEIVELDGGLSLSGNPRLDSLAGLVRLRRVGGSVKSGTGDESRPPPWEQLEHLESVGGRWIVSRTGLERLQWPPALTSIGGLLITRNDHLVDLGVANGNLNVVDGVECHSNPAIENEDVLAWLERLDVSGVQKVGNNGGSGPLDPCPWRDDGECDEGHLCASGTDSLGDCPPPGCGE